MSDCGSYLLTIIEAAHRRRNWDAWPKDLEQDAIKAIKASIRPHFRGRGNNLIKARCRLAKAQTWQELNNSVFAMEGEER